MKGIRVLELGRVPPAELPGMFLADMGADVLKIDTPSRTSTQAQPSAEIYAHTNRNKRSVALNLKLPEGRAIFMALARDADVVIEGFRPGVMKRLGTDYESVSAENPRIVYCSLSGFGQDGPYSNRPGHDLNFLALSGALSLWGSPDSAPEIPLNLVADYGGASMHAALAISMALFARERIGVGQYIDLSYLESTVSLLAATPNMRQFYSGTRIPRAGEGVFSGTYPYYTLYRTRDDRMLSVACSESHLWHNFCKAIERSELHVHARQADHYLRGPSEAELAARSEIAGVIRERRLSQWVEHFKGLDVCVAPVNSISEMLEDPQIRFRGVFTSVDHPTAGKIPQFASPLRLSKSLPTIRRPAPATGEHTDEVLQALGVTASAVAALRELGAVM